MFVSLFKRWPASQDEFMKITLARVSHDMYGYVEKWTIYSSISASSSRTSSVVDLSSIWITSPDVASQRESSLTRKVTNFNPISFRSCACSLVKVFPFWQSSWGEVNVGTPLVKDVVNPSFRSWGSSLWGKGSGGSEWCRSTGPTGSVTVRLAIFPARA